LPIIHALAASKQYSGMALLGKEEEEMLEGEANDLLCRTFLSFFPTQKIAFGL